MKKIIYLLLLVILPGLSTQAQTVYKDQVRVENQSITRSDDNRLTIAMDIICLLYTSPSPRDCS